MLEEESKAVAEVARTTGKAIDVVKSSGRALDEILGDTFRQLGGITSDWARYWRFKNTLHIADKVAAIARKRSLEGRFTTLPPGLALPLLEAASLESEEEIQSMWAALIANATDPTRKFALKKVFIEILRGLEPLDARVMQLLGDPEIDKIYTIQVSETLNADLIAQKLSSDPEEIRISIQTLARHGLVIDAWENTWDSIDYGYSGFRVDSPKSNFRLSHLGQRLLDATRVT